MKIYRFIAIFIACVGLFSAVPAFADFGFGVNAGFSVGNPGYSYPYYYNYPQTSYYYPQTSYYSPYNQGYYNNGYGMPYNSGNTYYMNNGYTGGYGMQQPYYNSYNGGSSQYYTSTCMYMNCTSTNSYYPYNSGYSSNMNGYNGNYNNGYMPTYNGYNIR